MVSISVRSIIDQERCARNESGSWSSCTTPRLPSATSWATSVRSSARLPGQRGGLQCPSRVVAHRQPQPRRALCDEGIPEGGNVGGPLPQRWHPDHRDTELGGCGLGVGLRGRRRRQQDRAAAGIGVGQRTQGGERLRVEVLHSADDHARRAADGIGQLLQPDLIADDLTLGGVHHRDVGLHRTRPIRATQCQ